MVLCLSFGANREENSATVIPPKAWTSRNNLQVDGTETITSPLHCNTTMATICQMASGIYSPVGSLSGVGKTQHTGELLCQHEVQEEQRLGIQVTRHVTLLQSSGKKFRDKLVLARVFFPETYYLSITYIDLDVLQQNQFPQCHPYLEQVTATQHQAEAGDLCCSSALTSLWQVTTHTAFWSTDGFVFTCLRIHV